MIAFLIGKIVNKFNNWIIVDVHGVGYKVFCDTSNLNDDDISLYIHHHIRENEQALYGFKSAEELQLFELLLTVNGVGPKAAMAIMSSASPEKIISAVAHSDASLFKTISGIGQKVAAKIIVELKNKVGGVGEIDLGGLEGSNEVVDALESLGYKKPEIAAALRAIPESLKDTQSKVTWVLKEIGGASLSHKHNPY